MDESNARVESLAIRVERLERQNRLLKGFTLCSVLLPVCLLVMGQAGPARTIEARRFVLRDSSGVKRAELGMGQSDAVLRFFNSKEQQTSLVSDGLIFLIDPQHEDARAQAGYVILSVAEGEPDITVRDTQGYSAILGVADTTTPSTGEQQRSTAASLKLFGPNKNPSAIWSAP